MQTVVYNINIENIQGSTILAGNNGNILLGSTGLSEWAIEAAKVIDRLSVRSQVTLLSYLYALEDGRDIPFYKEESA